MKKEDRGEKKRRSRQVNAALVLLFIGYGYWRIAIAILLVFAVVTVKFGRIPILILLFQRIRKSTLIPTAYLFFMM